MIYGNKLIYKYTTLENDREVEKQLNLVFSPLTLIKYHGYLGREFMQDFFELAAMTQKEISPALKTKIEKGEEIKVSDLSEEDIKSLSPQRLSQHIEFFLNLTVCMIATAEYPRVIDFVETLNSLPLSIYSDIEYFGELIDLVSFALKKNQTALGTQVARRI